MEKPSHLYHGSSNREITRFEPRALKVRDASEGPAVFATSDKRMATVFMIGVDDSWGNSGMHNGVPYMIISDRKRFEDLDQGGAIYHLPGETFDSDPSKGLGEVEWTSPEVVKPAHREDHKSALEAMLNHGVQVYFVDRETYEAYRAAPDQSLPLLRSLESENQKQGVNPVAL